MAKSGSGSKSVSKRTTAVTAQRGEPRTPAQRMADYRKRMRAAGLRPVQIWVRDKNAPEYIEKCIRQSRNIKAADAGEIELMGWVEANYDWPEP